MGIQLEHIVANRRRMIMKKLIVTFLTAGMILSLVACRTEPAESNKPEVTEEQQITEEVDETTNDSQDEAQNTESAVPEESDNSESEVTDETSSTSPLIGETYKKDDGSTIVILGCDSQGYINSIDFNGTELNLSDVELMEAVYGPDENTYVGTYNSNNDQIAISYFTTDESKIMIRFFGGSTTDSEIDITRDGEYRK